MEELKLLIEMVRDLPSMAIWVLIGYLIFQLAKIGSVYALIRIFLVKGHDYLKTKKGSVQYKEVIKDRVVNRDLGLDLYYSDESKQTIRGVLKRVANLNFYGTIDDSYRSSRYVSEEGAQHLVNALDEYLAKNQKDKNND